MSKNTPDVNSAREAGVASGEDLVESRRGIQSVEVGFSLLQVLARSRSKMPLKLLAESAGMSPSKAHLYLVSYIRLGLVAQDPLTSRYGLGSTAIQLGMAALNQLDLVEVARGPMHALQEGTGLSISLSIWGNRGPTIIYRIDGELPIPMSVQVGFVLPMLTTATGRIFMANLPKPAWQSLVEPEAKRNPAAMERAGKALEGIRQRRFALTQHENETGFFGASGPIIDGTGRLRAAVTALGIAKGTDLSEGGAVERAVTEAASRISAALGEAAP